MLACPLIACFHVLNKVIGRLGVDRTRIDNDDKTPSHTAQTSKTQLRHDPTRPARLPPLPRPGRRHRHARRQPQRAGGPAVRSERGALHAAAGGAGGNGAARAVGPPCREHQAPARPRVAGAVAPPPFAKVTYGLINEKEEIVSWCVCVRLFGLGFFFFFLFCCPWVWAQGPDGSINSRGETESS